MNFFPGKEFNIGQNLTEIRGLLVPEGRWPGPGIG